MRNWSHKSRTPFPILLSSDIRFGPTDYSNDQTWELTIDKGEPPALALATTYGLRVKILRIFPRFLEGDVAIIDPAAYSSPIQVKYLYPNLIALTFSPLPGINAEIEYWVPRPQVIAARAKINNGSANQRIIRLEWVAVLNPLPGGQRMMPADIGLIHILDGKTEGISPVLYLTNGARPGNGPFTSLTLDLELSPKDSNVSTWALASLEDRSSSYELARHTADSNWDAEISRIIQVNANLIDIHTSDPDWDLAFKLSQYRSLSLLLQNKNNEFHPSYVVTRLPDTGYSPRGDGSDYNHLWSGQTPLETYFLISLLLPTYPEFAKGLLLNFLDTQMPNGFVDWKPGLAGQRSQILATPLLASMVWRIYQNTEDKAFLEQTYPKLLAFIQHWFDPVYDRDSDGIPEWNHPFQTGLDEHPTFATWQNWSQGIDISTVESPDLCSFLYQECTILCQIANIIGRAETTPALQAIADHLKIAIEASWDESKGCYHYWDRESHNSSSYTLLGTHQGGGTFTIQRDFEHPERLQLEIQSHDEATRPLQIYIHGNAPSGGHRVEKIVGEDLRWHLGRCRVTSERTYSTLEQIEFQGLNQDDTVIVSTVSHLSRDITTLLPLWAGIPGTDRAKTLIKRTITNPKLFWGHFGLRTCVDRRPNDPDAVVQDKNTYNPYICLLVEGLMYYGHVNKAFELISHTVNGVVNSLKRDGSFRRTYNSDTGQGDGERDALSGLAPLGIFLDVLGVRILNSKRVILSGSNPFPWPVTVKYQGLTVLRQKHKTMIIFPDGQNVTIKNGKTCTVGLE